MNTLLAARRTIVCYVSLVSKCFTVTYKIAKLMLFVVTRSHCERIAANGCDEYYWFFQAVTHDVLSTAERSLGLLSKIIMFLILLREVVYG